jgi:hypothetical protein
VEFEDMSVNTIVETAQEFIARKTEEFQRDGKDMKLWHRVDLVGKHRVEAFTFMPDMYSGGRKVFLLERVSSENGPTYRVSYYMMNDDDMWTWMRSCPMFSRQEHDRLFAQAILDGTYI